jgi:hypothetical protein
MEKLLSCGYLTRDGWFELRLVCFFLNWWKTVLADCWFFMVIEEIERFSSSLVVARRRLRGWEAGSVFSDCLSLGSFSRYS